MSNMRRAYKHTHRCYKHAMPKSENKIFNIFKNKNIKILSLSIVCIIFLGIALFLCFNGQAEISNDLINETHDAISTI